MIEDLLISAAGAFGGTLGFAYVLNVPRRTVLPTSLNGMLGFLIYVLLARYAGQSLIFSYFFATVAVTVICEMLARALHLPSTIFLLTSLVPLVPGYNFYCAMLALVEDNGALAAACGLQAIQIVAAIAVGAAVTSVCFRALARRSFTRTRRFR